MSVCVCHPPREAPFLNNLITVIELDFASEYLNKIFFRKRNKIKKIVSLILDASESKSINTIQQIHIFY